MVDQAPQSPIDIDAAELDVAGLRKAFTSIQDMVRGLEAEIAELRKTQPEESDAFEEPILRLREGRGIRLLRRGRNSFEVGLRKPINPLTIQQVFLLEELDNTLRCEFIDEREITVMKPFDFQRQIYEAESGQFDGVNYEYQAVNKRKAFTTGTGAEEEIQKITRDYRVGRDLLIASGTLYILDADTNQWIQQEEAAIDLNVAGRAWAVDLSEDS